MQSVERVTQFSIRLQNAPFKSLPRVVELLFSLSFGVAVVPY